MISEQLIRQTEWIEKTYLGIRGNYNNKPVNLYSSATKHVLLYGQQPIEVSSKFAQKVIEHVKRNVDEIYTKGDPSYIIGNKILDNNEDYSSLQILASWLLLLSVLAVFIYIFVSNN